MVPSCLIADIASLLADRDLHSMINRVSTKRRTQRTQRYTEPGLYNKPFSVWRSCSAKCQK